MLLNIEDVRSLFSGLLPLFVLAHFAHHLLTALPVPLLPMIRSDFGVDYTQSGLVISAFVLAYGIGQVPARLRRLAYIIFLSTFTYAVLFFTISFVPLYLVDHFGILKETAAALVALINSAGLWAGPLGGYLSDRWGRVPVILAVCFVTGPLIYLLNLVPYRWDIVALLLIIGMTIYVRMPVSEAYIIGQTSEHHRSSILGIYFFRNMEGGGVLTPIMGYLIDRYGFSASFSMAGAVALAVTLVCSVLLWGSRE